MIPLLKGMRGARSSMVSQIVERRTSPASEALRSVYTAITLGSLDRAPHIIAVTAATPGEGKTTFAASMGALLAGMNAARRVLVVDLDLRQARMAEAFKITDRRGTIDEYLLWTKTPREIVINSINLLRSGSDRVGIVMNKVALRRHARYGYGDSGHYYSRYRAYYSTKQH